MDELKTVADIRAIDTALDGLSEALQRRSGSVFYSGRSAFSKPSNLYVLGLNPGGNPVSQAQQTIEADIRQFRTQPSQWSAYRDESWAGAPPGTYGMQPCVLHMFRELGLDPECVPASNVVFVRSANEQTLSAEKPELLKQCWPVHEAVIQTLKVKTIVCFGKTAGRWVREKVAADRLVDSFVEANARGWTSEAHLSNADLGVVTVTHPSRANWLNRQADPSPLIQRILRRAGSR